MQSEAMHAPLVIDPRVRVGATRRRRVALVALVLAVIVGATLLLVRKRPEPPRYRTAPVERRTITREVELTGHLDALSRVEVPAAIAGQLKEVTAHVGQKVTLGETLALLDRRSLVIAARGASAGVSAAASRASEAQASLSAATEQRVRLERLRARDLASERELEAAVASEAEARAALGTATAERARAAETLRGAELSSAAAVLTSPIAGIVLQAPDATGAVVDPASGPLFVVASDLTTLRITAEVSESEVSALRVEQAATFSVPAHPGRTFQARIERVGLDARRSASAVYYPVELRADNPSGALLPGMTTTVRVAVATVENALAVRDAALRFQPEDAAPAALRSRVFRIDGSGLAEVRVTAGLSDGAFTAVRAEPPSALSPGTEVALGVLLEGADQASGPGIRLGNR